MRWFRFIAHEGHLAVALVAMQRAALGLLPNIVVGEPMEAVMGKSLDGAPSRSIQPDRAYSRHTTDCPH